MTFLKTYRAELLIFALALAVRAIYFGMSLDAAGGHLRPAIEGADYFYVIAENLMGGNGYSAATEPPYTLNSVRPPVMPYFLVAAHTLLGGWGGALALLIAMGSLVPLLGMALARHVVPGRKAVLAVGVFLALEPFGVLFSTVFYSETLFMLFFLSSMLYLFRYFDTLRWYDLLVSSSLLGIATLTKPVVQYLPVFIMALILWQLRRTLSWKAAARAAGYGAVFLLIILPWAYRNHAEFGAWGISSQSTVNLYSVLVPSVLSVENGTTWGEEFEKLLAEDAKDPNRSSVAEGDYYVSRALPILIAHPIPLILVSANTSLNFFIHDGVYDVLRHLKIKPAEGLGGPALFLFLKDPIKGFAAIVHFAQSPFVLVLLGRLFWVALTLAFFWGGWRVLLTGNAQGLAMLVVVLYFMLTTLVVGLAVNARYRLPVNAFIVTVALYGALPIARRLRNRYDL